jgi:ATP-dependent Clp endopeptidase proteolytic subunit ClpP
MNVQFMAKGTTGEIWLYDSIGASFWGEGITAKQFGKDLNAMGKVTQINVRINSPGGDVFDGLAIYNLLRNHPASISVDVDGLAASIASIIAMAADDGQLRMASNAMMMIHDPHGVAVGSSKEMQRTAALLDQVKGNLVATYKQRTGRNEGDIAAWMEDETWFTANDALENGFADSMTAEQPVAACFDLSRFRNTPKALRNLVVTSAEDQLRRVRLKEQAAKLPA